VLNTLFVGVGIGVRVSSTTMERGGKILDSHSNFYSTGFHLINEDSVQLSGNLLYIQQPVPAYPSETPRDIVLSNSPNAVITNNISHAPVLRLSPTDISRVAVTVEAGSDNARIADNIFNQLGTGVVIQRDVQDTSVLDNAFFVQKTGIVDEGTRSAIRNQPASPPK